MRVLIDTCVIIDALQTREPFAKDAESIFKSAAVQRFSGYLTAKSIADLYYLMHHITHNSQAARDVLSKLLSLFGLLDTTGTDCLKAISSPVTDYEDAVMIETASRESMDIIVTRNLCDYSKSKVRIISPSAFLNQLQADKN